MLRDRGGGDGLEDGGAVVDAEAEKAGGETGVCSGESWAAVDCDGEGGAAGGDFEGVRFFGVEGEWGAGEFGGS